MKKLSQGLSTVVILMLVFLFTGASAYADDASDILTLVNEERAAAGLPPLTLNPLLNQAAMRHALDMATNGFFSHTGSDCSTPFVRISEAGYRYLASGENIAWGYTSAEEVMNGWMNSPGHRANILREYFTEMGLVRLDNLWVQTFGTPGGGQGDYEENCTPLQPGETIETDNPIEVVPIETPSDTTPPSLYAEIPFIEVAVNAAGAYINALEANIAPVAIFCNGATSAEGLAIFKLQAGNFAPALSLSGQRLSNSIALAQTSGQNQFIASYLDVTFWALTTGELQVQANDLIDPRHKYNFIFPGSSCGILPPPLSQ